MSDFPYVLPKNTELSDWIPHDGGECPVPGSALVHVDIPGLSLCPAAADGFPWNRVKRYRIIRPKQPTSPNDHYRQGDIECIDAIRAALTDADVARLLQGQRAEIYMAREAQGRRRQPAQGAGLPALGSGGESGGQAMTPEELDKATADEAWRLLEEGQDVAVIAARLARENWTPPEPVDPDLLACREWMISQPCSPDYREAVLAGKWDLGVITTGFLAGARMAREQEQERARVLVEPAEAIVNRAVKGTGSNGARWVHIVKAARRLEKGLTAYKAGKAAP